MNKILFPILALILVACTSALPQTQVTVTMEETVTLPPTATFTPITPEPADALTPISTATPFRYTSCADAELSASVMKAAIQAISAKGETFINKDAVIEKVDSVEDKIAVEKTLGRYDSSVSFSKESGVYITNALYLGSGEASLEHLSGAKPGDMVVCGYVAQENFESRPIPVVIGYVYQGVFHMTTYVNDLATLIDLQPSTNSLDKLRNLTKVILKSGDVLRVSLQTFSSFDTPEQVIAANTNGIIFMPWNIDAVLKLISLQDNDFMKRMDTLTMQGSTDNLDVNLGDLGLFVKGLNLKR